ncbi:MULTISPECIES: serine hydrolase [unclassified Herbaspirillum]|uniref:serine hydrolase domain-containing protein n=1 Tax=unclassified Herbaspirillum TaxID=2624150 RepID=UPI0011750F40|nr:MULTISPECIES: serine hydrolase [unclassified Herbaspirillum]MBB5393654.1 CubicO group peptidase (beta-lactamase class C family) [Herbaspirillum sp. SJZ102]TQK03600.1 CubicO group peptidase (beta-lactamase class C family) [Herbaspirillum sp. SJZ130]TQK08332.1 CubicO group peptidase (beta-lactamase class C family) [Herbaspirillum sp. SJZ106]
MNGKKSKQTRRRIVLLGYVLPALLAAAAASAAPDEEALGRDAGYPVGANLAQAYQQRYMVGSFSGMDSIGPSCEQAPSDNPLPLETAANQTKFYYRFRGGFYTLDDYMQHQRATAVVVIKDGRIVAERYNYGRTAQMRMLSNSMAKTIVALGIMKALEEGRIRSLDDRAQDYVPALAGTLYGGTRIVNLMRMASGARFVEDYSGHDDQARFGTVMRKQGTLQAAQGITERAYPEGEHFNYEGAQTSVLGLVLEAATGQTLCAWIGDKIWKPIGAQAASSWLLNPVDSVARAAGGFNATVHDYARLGMMLAADGMVRGQAVLSREHLLDMTDASRQPQAFRPGYMADSHGSTYFGYGLQTWIMPGSHRRFALLGIYGQAIFVDPDLKLVVVHTGVGKDASGDASGNHFGLERDALLRGIVGTYGNW